MSSSARVERHPMTDSLRRFFRTPKGLLILVLPILTVMAALGEGVARAAPIVAVAVLAAMVVDAPILRLRESEWTFPSGALLTGLLIAMILSTHVPWWVAAVASVIAIVSKYAFRVGNANVFNPAALALVAVYYLFHTAQSWWGALPEISPVAIVVLFAVGIFITGRVNKTPLVLSFLGCYYLLVTITAFVGDPAKVAVLYRAPDLHAVLFFAFFMVTDPPTSPPKYRDQLVNGVIVAVFSYAVYQLVGAVYFLLAGLLVGNAWESWRRWNSRTRRRVSDAT